MDCLLNALPHRGPSAHGQINCVGVRRTRALLGLRPDELNAQRVTHAAPQSCSCSLKRSARSSSKRSAQSMGARRGIDQLRVDANPVLVALHRALDGHIANAKLLADLLGVDALAFVGEGRPRAR